MADSPPQVNAFILCDQAFQQALTGKWCIIGTFGVIWGRTFPCEHTPLVVFVGLSDFKGPATVEVLIRDPDGERVSGVNAQIPEIPMSIAEFAFHFPMVRFPRPGSYTLELLVGSTFLTARSFRVEQAPAQGQAPGTDPSNPAPDIAPDSGEAPDEDQTPGS